MSEIDEILDYLEYIGQQKRSVSLVNTYLGVSITLEVNVLEVMRRRREVSVVTQYGRNISLLPATQILVHSDLFPRPIQAQVSSVDVHHRTAVLKNFSFTSTTQDNRKETRVQPKSKLSALVTMNGQNERSSLIADISVEGISLILQDRHVDLTQIFLPETSVRIFSNLPVSNQTHQVELSIPAKVSYIHAINPTGEYRAGFKAYPLDRQKNVLRRYIFDRQTEMFSELGQDSSPRRSSSMIL